jgi:TAG lipase/steryl ester hydrolase/phospholipase A2/LPA acyltransferase
VLRVWSSRVEDRRGSFFFGGSRESGCLAMDYRDEADAALERFAIAPFTLAQRVVAFRILFCRWVKRVRIAIAKRAQEVWQVWRRVMYRWLKGVSSWLNPRNPSVILLAAVVATMILRRAKVGSAKAERAYKRKFWSNLMKTALTYEEWAHAARMLEREDTRRKDSDLYDEDLVRSKLNELRLRRLEGGVEDILFCIRADLVRNLGNMCNPELHKGRLQTPRLIQEYINEVRYIIIQYF